MTGGAEKAKGINLTELRLESVIFHLVPQRPRASDPGSAGELSLSDAEQELPAALQQYLRDQIVSTFTRSRQRAAPNSDADSPLPALVTGYFGQHSAGDEIGKSFVELSKSAAAHLYECQRGNVPGGLLVAARGTAGSKPVLCLAKLEQQSGLSFEVVREGDSQRVIVALEDGLVLTDDTAVFKAAVFSVIGAGAAEALDVLVSDEQSGKVYSAPISAYWLRAFLGCTYSNDADVQTRAFVDAISKVVNSDIEGASERDHVHGALLVELGNNNSSIDPMAFIEANVPLVAQDAAIKRLRGAGAPTTAFPKGADVAGHIPKNTWYEYSDGTRVKVPIDHEVVVTKESTEDGDVLTVRGRIARIR